MFIIVCVCYVYNSMCMLYLPHILLTKPTVNILVETIILEGHVTRQIYNT